MRTSRLTIGGLALAGLGVLTASACGSSSNGGGGNNTNVGIVMGTTDKIVSLDPAGSYDEGSWVVIWNIYQTLLTVPPGKSAPVPDAATCNWQGSSATTYVCTLRNGMKFSDGNPVTGDDVVYSFTRVVKINNPNGPASLLAPMKSVTASGNTVTFTLSYPDATWPFVLTTGAGAIVEKSKYPATSLQPDDQVVGSGPYKLKKLIKGQLAEFVPNTYYGGDHHLSNSDFLIRYEQSETTLVSDLETGQIDVAFRTLSPTSVKALQSTPGVSVDIGNGIEIRYIVFNLKTQPGSNDAQKLAIRQAVAYTIDRNAIAQNDYNGTVKPLYSIIPAGLAGHIDSFAQVYGSSPNVSMAKQVLTAAGVSTPVSMDLWYNTDHYGAASTDEFNDVKRQLEASGLFTVKLQTAEWSTYNPAATSDQYPVFQLGWFPDYVDADDYTGPFYFNNRPCNTPQTSSSIVPFMNNHYCNDQVDHWISQEEASSDQTVRNQIFSQIQLQTAKDAPLIPLWQGGEIAGVRNSVTGVQSTLDPSYIFRFWVVGKSS